MSVLLDVNVLIALMWPQHVAHGRCREWFAGRAGDGWATCAITQAGCVRVLCDRQVWPNAPTIADMAGDLALRLSDPAHEFWDCELHLWDAIRHFRTRLHGYRQITDAYLLGLTIHRGGQLATLDRRLAALLPVDSPLASHILLIQ